MAYDKIASLTVEEMSALANRFEARAQSVLLRDQPQMQSDMRLAAKLIYELAGGAPTSPDQLRLRIGQALSKWALIKKASARCGMALWGKAAPTSRVAARVQGLNIE